MFFFLKKKSLKEPDLFAGVIADVPFCMVIDSMLDRSAPLTLQEIEEWGERKEEETNIYFLLFSFRGCIRPCGDVVFSSLQSV